MADIIKRIAALSEVPVEERAFTAWLDPQDALAFLKQNANDDELMMYVSLQHAFIHTVGVPASRVDLPDVDDLLEGEPSGARSLLWRFALPARTDFGRRWRRSGRSMGLEHLGVVEPIERKEGGSRVIVQVGMILPGLPGYEEPEVTVLRTEEEKNSVHETGQ